MKINLQERESMLANECVKIEVVKWNFFYFAEFAVMEYSDAMKSLTSYTMVSQRCSMKLASFFFKKKK